LFATSFILVGLFLIWSTASSLDKTDLKKSSWRLFKKNEWRFRKIVYQRTQEIQAIFDSPLVSILTTDLNGVITNFNKGAERQLGYSAEVVGKWHQPVSFRKRSVAKEQRRV
jgi:PAS domain-containing protein